MFFEALLHLWELDLSWFVYIFFSNLHYLFLFAALIYIFRGYRSMWYGVLMFTFVAWVLFDLNSISNWVVFVGGFLFLYYVTKIVFMLLAEGHPWWNKQMFLLSTIQGLSMLAIYNWFLV